MDAETLQTKLRAHEAWLRGEFGGERANLRDANLLGANLLGANLLGADLWNAVLPHHDLPDGSLTVWKRCQDRLVQLRIPQRAQRVMPLTSRKCRAELAEVLWVEGNKSVTSERGLTYAPDTEVWPDVYDPDPRVACSHGIHFFLTRAEAEEW